MGLGRAGDLGDVVRVLALTGKVGAEHAMDDEVAVAADGRGEVSVVVFMQTEMAVGAGAIAGFFEAAQELGAQGVALRVVGEEGEQLDQLLAVGEVADADVVGDELLAELVEFFDVGIVVHTVNGREFFAAGEAGDGLVSGEHKLLNELVALVVLDFFEAVGVTLGVHEDLGLGHVEVEGTVGHAIVAESGGEVPELANPGLQVGELGLR